MKMEKVVPIKISALYPVIWPKLRKSLCIYIAVQMRYMSTETKTPRADKDAIK